MLELVQLTKHARLARRLPSPLYRWLARRWIDYEFPRHLYVELTAWCNLACAHCPQPKPHEEMDFGLFRSIIDEAAAHGPRSFSLHILGEPLLYSRILEAAAYIKERNPRNTVILTTNGTLLNRFIGPLVEQGVGPIIWSWRENDFSPATLERLRKVGIIRFLDGYAPEGEFERWEGYRRERIRVHNYGGTVASDIEDARRYPCHHLWLAPGIRHNGDFSVCCVDPHRTLVLGNVRDQSIHALWTGDKMRVLREDHRQGRYPGACLACNAWTAYPAIW
jgi:MoaA/NifB/PqqE/SkfB family radical SAM enzyme